MNQFQFTQQPDRWPHLLRMWGRDQHIVTRRDGLVPNDNRVIAVWFPTQQERERYKASLGDLCVVRDSCDGEDADTSCVTWVEVTLRVPDGREFTFKESFGYGYPPHSAVFMWEEGNYSCDCNRVLFLARACPESGFSEDDEVVCGDTIAMPRLRVYQVRPDGSEVTIDVVQS